MLIATTRSTSMSVRTPVAFALAFQLAAGAAHAQCPAFLAKIKTAGGYNLCSLAERYARARDALVAKGYSDPDRIAEVIAPRFINYADWNSRKSQPRFNYSPWAMYCPAPQTWSSWERANESILKEARWDLSQGKLSPISMDWIIRLWK